ncbi:ATP-dependent Clp protease ATP-binding subunit ClpC, partial [Enterococcus faecium]
AARIRQKEKQVMEKLEELIAVKEKSLSGYSTQVTEEDVAGVVSQWTGVPLQQLEKKESERLMKLETILHQRVLGQNEAVEALSRAIRRAR